MKELMGQTSLQWDTKRLQGAYSGAAYDPNSSRVQQVVQCEIFHRKRHRIECSNLNLTVLLLRSMCSEKF
jgi:hypothetical protein